jgi:phosphotransferase system enzyme I (PtsI)
MCGELAGDAQMTEALLGFGLTELSMGAAAIPRVKEGVRTVSCQQAEPWAQRLLDLESPADVRTAAAHRQGTVER